MGKFLFSEPEYSGEFQIVEISSQLPDYKLCFHLNGSLDIKLAKKEDLTINNEEKGKADIYSIFVYNQDYRTTFYYLRKSSQTGTLAPLSYLMITKPLSSDLIAELVANVAKINEVFHVREVPLAYEKGTPAMIKTRQEINNILTELELYLIEPKKPNRKFKN